MYMTETAMMNDAIVALWLNAVVGFGGFMVGSLFLDYILGRLPQSFRPDMESAPTVLQGAASSTTRGALRHVHPYSASKSVLQPSSTSRHVAEKSPVYHGSATSPGRAV